MSTTPPASGDPRRWSLASITLTSLLVGLSLSHPAAAEEARVEAVLMPEVTVRGTQILLGDLGVLRGEEALVAQVRAVVVGQAPLPGREREIDPNYIRIRLRQSRIDPATVEILAPARIRVRTAAHVVTAEEQIREAEAALRRLAGEPADPDLLVEAATPPAPITVPDGTVEIVADPGSAAPGAGSIRAVRLSVRVDGKPAASASVTVRVRRLTQVWVVAKAVAAGSQLAEGDARVEKRDVAALQRPLPPDQPVTGLRARRALTAGAVLTSGSLEAVADVRRGATLTLMVRSGAVRVRAAVRALEDGAVGDTIRVAGPGGQEFRARLIAAGAAEMVVGG